MLEQFAQEFHPMGNPVTPEDVAVSIAFLASEDARMITGINHVIDGGFLLAGPPPSMSPDQWDGNGQNNTAI